MCCEYQRWRISCFQFKRLFQKRKSNIANRQCLRRMAVQVQLREISFSAIHSFPFFAFQRERERQRNSSRIFANVLFTSHHPIAASCRCGSLVIPSTRPARRRGKTYTRERCGSPNTPTTIRFSHAVMIVSFPSFFLPILIDGSDFHMIPICFSCRICAKTEFWSYRKAGFRMLRFSSFSFQLPPPDDMHGWKELRNDSVNFANSWW